MPISSVAHWTMSCPLREAALRPRFDLRCIAEQAVSIKRRTRRFAGAGRRRHGHDAVEVGRPDTVLDRVAFGVQQHRPAGGAAREQEARHHYRALHVARDFSRIGFIDGFRHGERRRRAFDDAVGEVVVAERRERCVAHRELAPGVVFIACNREVPSEIQARTPDSSTFQLREDFFEVRASFVDLFFGGGQVVAVGAEALRRLQVFFFGVFEVAQGDDVAVARGEVDGRVDLQVGLFPL